MLCWIHLFVSVILHLMEIGNDWSMGKRKSLNCRFHYYLHTVLLYGRAYNFSFKHILQTLNVEHWTFKAIEVTITESNHVWFISRNLFVKNRVFFHLKSFRLKSEHFDLFWFSSADFKLHAIIECHFWYEFQLFGLPCATCVVKQYFN